MSTDGNGRPSDQQAPAGESITPTAVTHSNEKSPPQPKLVPKQFQVKPEAYTQFNLLVAEHSVPGQPRPGPRLIAEALNLLFEKYGKDLVA